VDYLSIKSVTTPTDKWLWTETGELSLSAVSVNLPAKVDTGASHCIFERRHGEALGLSIEISLPQLIGATTGRFLA
jgi:hypothetical protein